MTVLTLGKATITRVEETYLPTYPLRDIFPEASDAHVAEHRHWLAPHHYDAEKGLIKLSVHSWLLQIGGKKILIDSCCGNNKIKPGRPFWNKLNIPYLERLAAAGARPEEIDLVMCTHLAPRSCRLEYAATRRQMGSDLSQCAVRLLKARRRLLFESRCRPEGGACGVGNVPRVRDPDSRHGKADLVSGGPYRLNEFIEIDSAPGIHRGTFSSSWRAMASARLSLAMCGTTCCRSIIRTGISRRTLTRSRRA